MPKKSCRCASIIPSTKGKGLTLERTSSRLSCWSRSLSAASFQRGSWHPALQKVKLYYFASGSSTPPLCLFNGAIHTWRKCLNDLMKTRLQRSRAIRLKAHLAWQPVEVSNFWQGKNAKIRECKFTYWEMERSEKGRYFFLHSSKASQMLCIYHLNTSSTNMSRMMQSPYSGLFHNFSTSFPPYQWPKIPKQ